jgi:hypothetical protein
MGQSYRVSAVMVPFDFRGADAGTQALHHIIYRNLREHVFYG